MNKFKIIIGVVVVVGIYLTVFSTGKQNSQATWSFMKTTTQGSSQCGLYLSTDTMGRLNLISIDGSNAMLLLHNAVIDEDHFEDMSSWVENENGSVEIISDGKIITSWEMHLDKNSNRLRMSGDERYYKHAYLMAEEAIKEQPMTLAGTAFKQNVHINNDGFAENIKKLKHCIKTESPVYSSEFFLDFEEHNFDFQMESGRFFDSL